MIRVCKKCGHRNQEQDVFCANCDVYLPWNSDLVADPNPPPQPPPTPPPQPQAQQRPEGFVDRVKYVLDIDQKQQQQQQAGAWEAPDRQAQPGVQPQPPVQPQPGGWVAPSTATASSAPPPVAPPPPVQPRPPMQPLPPPQPPVQPPVQPPDPQARRPDLVPSVIAPRPTVAPRAPDVQEAGVYCPHCGAGNDTRRHFCRRCGASLALAVQMRIPWWRRLFPKRQPRDRVAGDRRSTKERSEVTFGSLLRTFVLTMLAVVLMGGILAYALVPGFRQAVNLQVDLAWTQVRRILNPTYVQVHAVSTNASSSIAGHPASFLTDGVNNDYWAADLTRDPQPTMEFTFDGKTDLDAVVITDGANGPDFTKYARAKTLQITYSDGTGETVTLQDASNYVPYTIHARGVTSMTVRITSVYPVAGSTDVAMVEIEFRRLQ